MATIRVTAIYKKQNNRQVAMLINWDHVRYASVQASEETTLILLDTEDVYHVREPIEEIARQLRAGGVEGERRAAGAEGTA